VAVVGIDRFTLVGIRILGIDVRHGIGAEVVQLPGRSIRRRTQCHHLATGAAGQIESPDRKEIESLELDGRGANEVAVDREPVSREGGSKDHAAAGRIGIDDDPESRTGGLMRWSPFPDNVIVLPDNDSVPAVRVRFSETLKAPVVAKVPAPVKTRLL